MQTEEEGHEEEEKGGEGKKSVKVVCDWCEGDGRARAMHPSHREPLAAVIRVLGLKPVQIEGPPAPKFDWNIPCPWCFGTGEREPQ